MSASRLRVVQWATGNIGRRALLETGRNIVTTCGGLFAGGEQPGEECRARVLDACARGGASIYATRSSPGFITDALPLALLSMEWHVEAMEIEEFANLSRRDSPHLLFKLMGFGQPVESFDARRSSLGGAFGCEGMRHSTSSSPSRSRSTISPRSPRRTPPTDR